MASCQRFEIWAQAANSIIPHLWRSRHTGVHRHSPAFPQCPCALGKRRAGRGDIVNENSRPTLDALFPAEAECVVHVSLAAVGIQCSLGAGIASAGDAVFHDSEAGRGRESTGKALALVVTAPGELGGMERDGDQECIRREGEGGERFSAHETAQDRPDRGNAMVLEGVDQRPAELVVGEEHHETVKVLDVPRFGTVCRGPVPERGEARFAQVRPRRPGAANEAHGREYEIDERPAGFGEHG